MDAYSCSGSSGGGWSHRTTRPWSSGLHIPIPDFWLNSNYFFEKHRNIEFFDWLNDENWIGRLAYLVDTFVRHNKLNILTRGRNTSIIEHVDSLKSFKSGLQNWNRKIKLNNFVMFWRTFFDFHRLQRRWSTTPQTFNTEILQHLTAL